MELMHTNTCKQGTHNFGLQTPFALSHLVRPHLGPISSLSTKQAINLYEICSQHSLTLSFSLLPDWQYVTRLSLHIHVEACQKKWLAAEATKAPRDRRPLPPPPQEMSGGTGLPASVQAQDEFNASMSQYFDKVSLMPCGICGRTFRWDILW